MNVKIEKFNNYCISLQPVFKQNSQSKPPDMPSDVNKKSKDSVNKSMLLLTAIGTITLGGIIYAICRGRMKHDAPQTHFERLNCFGKKIIEDLKLDNDGKLVQKQIEHNGIKYVAKYSEGKLIEVEGYKPRHLEEFFDEKYSILYGIIRDNDSELIVSRNFDDKMKYWLFSKNGETVTQVDEIKVESDAMYQYGNCQMTPEKSFAYQIEETYSPKDNIPFGEIYECFTKGLL